MHTVLVLEMDFPGTAAGTPHTTEEEQATYALPTGDRKVSAARPQSQWSQYEIPSGT